MCRPCAFLFSFVVKRKSGYPNPNQLNKSKFEIRKQASRRERTTSKSLLAISLLSSCQLKLGLLVVMQFGQDLSRSLS
jgi:hypothetical protein